MELLQLKYFCMAARLQSMTRAAERYHVPQSAISVTVARLEDELGTRLFDRIGNRVYLNEKGKAFLLQAERALSTLEDARLQAAEPTAPAGEVRLLLLSDRNWIAHRLLPFWHKYPDICFSLCHSLYKNQLFPFDLCGASAPPEGELENQELFTERFLLAVPRTHRLAQRKSVALEELERERFLLTPPGSSIERTVSAACHSCGFSPSAALISDDPFLIRRCVSQGLGITFAPERSWQGLFDDAVVLLPLKGAPVMRTVRLYWHKMQYLTGAVRTVKDFLLDAENSFCGSCLQENGILNTDAAGQHGKFRADS